MWLPKDERVLLAHYYNWIGQPSIEQHFRNSQLVELLTLKKRWEIKELQRKRGKDFKKIMQEQSLYGERINRLSIANKTLSERDLITLQPYLHDPDVIVVTLGLKGYDLGRKYSHWWTRSGLWFAEYKHHWIWVIVAFVGGIVATVLAQWLSKVFT